MEKQFVSFYEFMGVEQSWEENESKFLNKIVKAGLPTVGSEDVIFTIKNHKKKPTWMIEDLIKSYEKENHEVDLERIAEIEFYELDFRRMSFKIFFDKITNR